jgi:Protein of unknown function (DUF2630)
MSDDGIHDRIEQLVSEEHELRSREGAGHSGTGDRERLDEIGVALDRCWDLLRQRRALREADLDPNAAHVRSEGTVEHYQQ